MVMKKIKKITETELMEIVNTLLEQDSKEDIIYLDPKEVIKYYDDLDYEDFTRLSKFRNKKIYVNGDLDLRSKPIETLGGIDYVDGKLDISYTNIKTLGNTRVKGYVNDWGTPLQKARIAAERAAEKAEADSKRDGGYWDLTKYPDDKETIMANVLWDYLVNHNEVNTLTPEKKVELKELEEKLNELNNRYEQETESEIYDELYDEIQKVEEEIEELKENTGDVYNLSPTHDYYGLLTFRVVGLNVPYEDEWTIGTYEQAEESALEYYKTYINDIGSEGWSKSFVEDYIDVEKVQEQAEQMYEDWVRQEPSSYFSDRDFDNSDIEDQISNLEDEVSEMEEQLRDIEDSDSDEYSELQELIDEKNEQIEKLEESKITEPTEEMIEEKIKDLVDDATQNPLNWLEDLGYSNTDLKDWVDYDSLAEGLRDSDGIGGMNGYNSDYDTTDFNGETYVVMQTNG